MDIREIIRLTHNLRGDSQTVPPYDARNIALADGLNVRFVTLSETYGTQLRSFRDPRERTIYVNRDQPVHHKNRTIAVQHAYHRLYPEVEGMDRFMPTPQPEDADINAFVHHLLLPVKDVCEYARVLGASGCAQMFVMPLEDIMAQMEVVRRSPELVKFQKKLRLDPEVLTRPLPLPADIEAFNM